MTWAVWLSLLSLVSAAAHAESAPPQLDMAAGNLALRVKALDLDTTADAVTLEVSLSATGGEEAFVDHVVIRPQGPWGDLFPEAQDECPIVKKAGEAILPKAPAQVRICMVRPGSFWGTQLQGFFVPPGRHGLVVSVLQDGRQRNEAVLWLPLRVAYSTVIIGGVIGALLLASLEFLLRLLDKGAEWPGMARVAASLLRVLASAACGGITAFIVIICSKTSTMTGFPIALNVDSVWGGILIGLVSLPLARAVEKRFTSAGGTRGGAGSGQPPPTTLS